ncbi:MAG: thiamine ABC transporter substrate-binding protein, partial [Bdellovibrionota bacterium]
VMLGRPGAPPAGSDSLKVMAYSSFLSSWGPGPDIAKMFQAETGIAVEFQDGGDAGMLLEKMKLFPVDVVVGLDGLTLAEAKKRYEWRPIEITNVKGFDSPWREPEFVPFDWGALTFVYRKSEIANPPRSLKDLLHPRFKGKIALQDPRTSAPGQQFLFWVLDVYGEEEGFKYLAALKPNIHSVSAGWSTAYGTFTSGSSKTAFSYLTSPIYHWTQEGDDKRDYQAAIFEEGHPVHVEFAGIPSTCTKCDAANQFAHFLLKPEIQKIIMTKNIMMPVISSVKEGTAFTDVPSVQIRDMKSLATFLEKRTALFERWRTLGL